MDILQDLEEMLAGPAYAVRRGSLRGAINEIKRLREACVAALEQRSALLEALKAMMEVQDCTEDCWCLEEGTPQPCEACRARAAIAKAEGR